MTQIASASFIFVRVGTKEGLHHFISRIREYDRRIEQMARKDYPEAALLQQVKGVCELIALT
jgi:hypothetical protein